MAARGKGQPTEERQRLFLEAFEAVGVIAAAARIAGISKSSHYEWLADADYAAAFAESEKAALDNLIYAARKRAVEGVEKPVMHGGQRCFELMEDPERPGKMIPDYSRPIISRETSDNLLMFLIKQRDPSYRESSKVEHSGPAGGAISIEVCFVDPAGTDAGKS